MRLQTMEHKILHDEKVDEQEPFVVKTSHEKITYDELTECFIVDLGEGAWCEVYGYNRFTRAIELADLIYR